jgi:ferredoxin
MGKEYFFSQIPNCTFALGEAFAEADEGGGSSYLVSNSESVPAEVYAPEINFYIQGSLDSVEKKTENIRRLYKIRAIAYDLAQQTDLIAEIGRKVILLSAADQDPLCEELEKHGYALRIVAPESVVDVSGSIGCWKISVTSGREHEVLEADQVLWRGGPSSLTRRRGIHDPDSLGTAQTVATLLADSGNFSYTNFIKYNASLCHYHHRRSSVCGDCAVLCPTGAITKRGTPKELAIADIDCNGCGGCVGICPTGAIDYAPIPRSAWQNMSSFYKERSALILTGNIIKGNPQLNLHENILPFFLENIDFLDECHLLTLLQKSGYPVIIFTDKLSLILKNVVSLLNEIFMRKYNRPALFVCSSKTDLSEVARELSPFPEILYDLDERSLGKREIFAKRLSYLVGKDDFGSVSTGPYLRYGSIHIDEGLCTLCLSCADACNTGALKVHAEDNTLRYTPALCTVCGYCEATCPEKNCLHIGKDQLALHPDFFRQKVMATDEIFNCVECGKGFAPAKAVGKIAAIMQPFFGEDRVRIRSLYCCPDCKAKLMLESLRIENTPGNTFK